MFRSGQILILCKICILTIEVLVLLLVVMVVIYNEFLLIQLLQIKNFTNNPMQKVAILILLILKKRGCIGFAFRLFFVDLI